MEPEQVFWDELWENEGITGEKYPGPEGVDRERDQEREGPEADCEPVGGDSDPAGMDERVVAGRQPSGPPPELDPRAVSAHYNRKSRRVEIELADGCLLAFPVATTPELRRAKPALLKRIEVTEDGGVLRWEGLDVELSVVGLLAGRFSRKAWTRENARRVGSMTSPAKARAARENGKKGGRPRKER
ncbi:MAG: DUF2442 domain-containing protein [Gemmatimonadota bacterium]|jgi:hypothetical protein|nr:DUF2442 domain-containing protein [Gemmatimonadota bacterium]